MDGELLNSSLSIKNNRSDAGEQQNPPISYSDVFYKKFPYYLSIGMTEEQYWDKDCNLVKYYRESYEIKTERMNQEAWLQGMYFYDALARVSPIIRAFAKKGTKAEPYPEEAYPIGKRAINNANDKKERENYAKAKRYMEAYMVQYNKKFEERK